MGFILPAIPDDATLEQLEDAGRAISAAVARLVAAGAGPGEPSLCPRCGRGRFVRKGGDADGAQRYLCRGRSRTFTAKTMGLLSNSKPPP